ncbi:MAG: TadE/TadG family type IV pilus assembly protein [Alphaproteobacteria bacterium]|nr:TadE/TadG family type IV pilus assembly protein [Alphaproteobacteria bacterium]
MTRFIHDPAKAITTATRAKGLRALWRDRDGAAAVEFAFILPILLLLFSGIVQFGSIMFLENHMTNVARETSRRVAVGELAQDDAKKSAQQALINWGVTYEVLITPSSAGGGNDDITVAISLPMADAALMDVLGVFQSGNLTATVTMRQES